MADFLLELLSEEIPARMQEKASADLARLFTDELAKAGLTPESLTSYVTPRRLALIARGLPLETAAVSDEIKGPKASAPPQALEGFLRKTGLTADQLVERDGTLFAVIEKPGRATTGVLAEAIPAIVRAFPWPKSMRWGTASQSTASLRWVRPLQGVVALLGDDVVSIEIDGIVSGAATVGHRFHHPGIITIGNADDYEAKLRACHVIVDPAERRELIRTHAAELADQAGLSVVPDEGLIAENAGLTEWPVPLLGHFDPAFLEVPREVIQLTLRTNQKYFVLNDKADKLAPAFICTANITARDGGVGIVAGNGKVLAARLSDAKFFWEQDLKSRLEDHLPKLKDVIFHEKLGSIHDRMVRFERLAAWISAVTGADEQAVVRAAQLSKTDLMTNMVGEFPELQGIIGTYYAHKQGEDYEVAEAIKEQYLPLSAGGQLPVTRTGTALSLIEKFETVVGFIAVGEKPTGSRDPYAVRRACLGLIRLIIENNIRGSVKAIIDSLVDAIAVSSITSFFTEASKRVGKDLGEPSLTNLSFNDDLSRVIIGEFEFDVPVDLRAPLRTAHQLDQHGVAIRYEVFEFIVDRLKVQQREAGVRHDLIDAVFALGGEEDLVRLLARVKALQAFVETEDGVNLLAGYKRAANILKKEGGVPAGASAVPGYAPEPAEFALIAALDAAEPKAAAAIEAEDFAAAMSALASLRGPIDAFFDAVTVNDPIAAKRNTRLALLEKIRVAVHNVADFSKIEG